MHGLHTSQNLTMTFAALTKSVTNGVRHNMDGNESMRGHLVRYETWARLWFLVPHLFLIAHNDIFLAIVISHTHESRMMFTARIRFPT